MNDSPGGADKAPPGAFYFLLPVIKLFLLYYLISTFLPFAVSGLGGALTGHGISEPAATFYGLLGVFAILAYPSTVLLTLWGLNLYRMTPAEIGWERPRNAFTQAASGAACALLLWLAAEIPALDWLDFLTHPRSYQLLIQREELVSGSSHPVSLYFLLTSWSVAAFLEEVFFRGLLYSVVKKRIGSLRAAAVICLLFACEHFHYGGHSRPLSFSSFGGLMAVGAAFCLLREWSGNLLAPIVAHGTVSLLAAVLKLAPR